MKDDINGTVERADSAVGRVLAIVRKEIVDSLRDRRTLITMFITAIAAGPILMLLVVNLAASQADRTRALHLPVAGADRAPALIAFLTRQQVEIVPAPADFEAQVRAGDLDVVLEIDSGFVMDVAQGKPGIVHVIYDRSRDRARNAIAQTEALLRAYNRDWGRGRLLLRGVAPEVANPLEIDVQDLATPQGSGSLVLFMIAYYGLFAAVIGGIAASIDTTAGERERQSLEPLLLTPARPLELVLGKWLAVVLLDAVVVLVTLLGFYLTLRFGPLPSIGIPFLFGMREVGRFVVTLVPMVLLMPAVLLYVGARGRTFKESQSNVSIIFFVISVVPLVQMFAQTREPWWLRWVPVSSQYGLLRDALRGDALQLVALAQSYALPLLLGALALVGTARLLARESALAGK